MENETAIVEALKKDKLDFPELPVVELIEAEPIVDSSGVDSLEVWVVLSDSTEYKELTGEAVVQIKSAISESLLEKGVTLFPYIRLILRSDYEERRVR